MSWTRTLATTNMKSAHSAASSRSLKMMRLIASGALSGASSWPCASASAQRVACARKPTFGSAGKIFCQPAVSVQISSHVAGASVTQA